MANTLSLLKTGLSGLILLGLSAAFLPVSAKDGSSTSLSSLGDPRKGQRVFNRCKACHNLSAAPRTRLGPNLDNLFGKKAGTASNYKYSRALREVEFIWTEEKLDQWLLKPGAFLPGNKMSFAGIRKEQDRKDLIAYLRQSTIKKDE